MRSIISVNAFLTTVLLSNYYFNRNYPHLLKREVLEIEKNIYYIIILQIQINTVKNILFARSLCLLRYSCANTRVFSKLAVAYLLQFHPLLEANCNAL